MCVKIIDKKTEKKQTRQNINHKMHIQNVIKLRISNENKIILNFC